MQDVLALRLMPARVKVPRRKNSVIKVRRRDIRYIEDGDAPRFFVRALGSRKDSTGQDRGQSTAAPARPGAIQS